MTELEAYLRKPARRQVLTGMAGISLAALLADPVRVAQAAASLKSVTAKTASGRTVNAALALPANAPAGGIMIVHEFWGLNDQIKSVAAQLAEEGFVALAIDLYDGKVATDQATAQQLMGGVQDAQATETVVTWVDQLYGMKQVNGKVATLGFCFGGGWSLNASLAHPVEGTVIYYGRCDKSPAELQKLKGPVIGHFAGKDGWITPKMVDGFEAAMKQDGKPATIYRYADANHAFANPTGQSYEKADARLAWDRTVEFLKKTIA